MATAYSLMAVREGEEVKFHYEGHNRVMQDGKPTGELEQFGPGDTIGSRARLELKDIMRLRPHVNRMQLEIWES